MIPTLAIVNGRVFTADDDQPAAEAVAVHRGKIMAVGANDAIRSLCGPQTDIVDGRGRTVMPGFIDSHFHLEWGSQTLVGAQLYGVTTLEELAAQLSRWLSENHAAPWVLGQGGSYALPTLTEPLTRHHLDQIVMDRPLVITAFDMHSMFVNTAALQAAGIFNNPPVNLANGDVVVGSDGRPTGELYEMDAMALIQRALPELTVADRIAQTQKGLALAAEHGITSMHNMDGDVEQGQLYAIMEDQGTLTARVSIPYWVKPEVNVATMLEQAGEMKANLETPLIRAGRVKFFMDGVYESHTAVTLSGYPEKPNHVGKPIWEADRFAKFATAADAAGLQIAVHACGDGAVRRVLDGYQAAQQANGRRDSRHRIEHIEMVSNEEVFRFVDLGVTASMQPLHAPLQENDPDVWATRIHPREVGRAFAWCSLREAGVPLAFGSDWPVVTLDPILGVWGAVNRQPFRPGASHQQQTVAEALLSYTRDAAWADFQDGVVGQLKPGLAADIVILSDDIFVADPDEIKQLKVDLTVFNGEIVYQKK